MKKEGASEEDGDRGWDRSGSSSSSSSPSRSRSSSSSRPSSSREGRPEARDSGVTDAPANFCTSPLSSRSSRPEFNHRRVRQDADLDMDAWRGKGEELLPRPRRRRRRVGHRRQGKDLLPGDGSESASDTTGGASMYAQYEDDAMARPEVIVEGEVSGSVLRETKLGAFLMYAVGLRNRWVLGAWTCFNVILLALLAAHAFSRCVGGGRSFSDRDCTHGDSLRTLILPTTLTLGQAFFRVHVYMIGRKTLDREFVVPRVVGNALREAPRRRHNRKWWAIVGGTLGTPLFLLATFFGRRWADLGTVTGSIALTVGITSLFLLSFATYVQILEDSDRFGIMLKAFSEAYFSAAPAAAPAFGGKARSSAPLSARTTVVQAHQNLVTALDATSGKWGVVVGISAATIVLMIAVPLILMVRGDAIDPFEIVALVCGVAFVVALPAPLIFVNDKQVNLVKDVARGRGGWAEGQLIFFHNYLSTHRAEWTIFGIAPTTPTIKRLAGSAVTALFVALLQRGTRTVNL